VQVQHQQLQPRKWYNNRGLPKDFTGVQGNVDIVNSVWCYLDYLTYIEENQKVVLEKIEVNYIPPSYRYTIDSGKEDLCAVVIEQSKVKTYRELADEYEVSYEAIRRVLNAASSC
jgi:hypothetical protein